MIFMRPIFVRAESREDIETICKIAKRVWHLAYDELLPHGQVEYMLEKYQSPKAILEQIEKENYQYYIAKFEGIPGGFIGFSPKYEGRDEVFLSKLYFLPEYRGKGGARAAVELAVEEARKEGLSQVSLTVNRGNSHAVEVYLALGFEISESRVTDIGGGYVMDDYIMVRKVGR